MDSRALRADTKVGEGILCGVKCSGMMSAPSGQVFNLLCGLSGRGPQEDFELLTSRYSGAAAQALARSGYTLGTEYCLVLRIPV